MTTPYNITEPHLHRAALALIQRPEVHALLHRKTALKLYGVPRGGIPAAYQIAMCSSAFMMTGIVEDADLIVDDLIHSGATMQRYREQYPNIPFVALYAKNPTPEMIFGTEMNPDRWLVFPWEGSLAGSVSDIGTRLLEFIGEDTKRAGIIETPERYAKAWKAWTSGYAMKPEDVLKYFEDGSENYDELLFQSDIPVYSQCEHHLAPFWGVAHIAYLPDKRIVGLSKLSRLVDIFAKRLQVQERLTTQIAGALTEHLHPRGVAVVVQCRHMCMESRGVQRMGTTTTTSSLSGALKDGPARAEFFSLLNALGGPKI